MHSKQHKKELVEKIEYTKQLIRHQYKDKIKEDTLNGILSEMETNMLTEMKEHLSDDMKYKRPPDMPGTRGMRNWIEYDIRLDEREAMVKSITLIKNKYKTKLDEMLLYHITTDMATEMYSESESESESDSESSDSGW